MTGLVISGVPIAEKARLTETELYSLATYMLTVRQYLGDMLKDQGIVGYDEKADRQTVNKNFTILTGWSAGIASRAIADELAQTLPISWNRKAKKKV